MRIRDDIILKYAKGRKVLDLGCVDHDVKNMLKPSSLHSKLKKVAKKVVGVDIIEAPGIIKADVRNFDLKEKFDVIVAGEIIEHIDDHRGFLKSVKKHMKKDSVFIISTPNVFSISYFIEYIVRRERGFNPTHTCWFSEKTLRFLLESNGYIIEKIYKASLRFYELNFIGKLVSLLSEVLNSPNTIIFVSRKNNLYD